MIEIDREVFQRLTPREQRKIAALRLEQSELARKREARSSLAAFASYLYPWYRTYHHSRIIVEELEKFFRGETLRLILTVGPQHGKSLHSSILLPAYILGRNPDARVLLLSYGATLAGDFNCEVQKVMDSEEYLALFPDSALGQENVVTLSDKPRRNKNVLDMPGHSGMFVNAGVSGGYTGKGFHYIILDDLIKSREEAESPRERQKIKSAYSDTIRTRRRDEHTGILILNTRWHEDDLSGWLVQSSKEDAHKEQWRVVNLPTLLSDCVDPEAERWKFPRGQEPGKEVLWPEKFGYADVMATRAEGLYNFSAQYMGNPTARDGNAIKREWYEPIVPVFDPSEVVSARLAYDVAFTDNPKGDWTWGSLKAKMKDGTRLTLWMHFGHWLNDERRRHLGDFGIQVKRMMSDLMPHAQWMITLEAGVGAGVAITQDDIQHLLKLGLPAKAVEIKKSSKPVRAISYLSATEAHLTKFYGGSQLNPYGLADGLNQWINPFFHEVLSLLYSDDGLSFIGGHDDPIDAEVMADDGLMEKPKINYFARNII